MGTIRKYFVCFAFMLPIIGYAQSGNIKVTIDNNLDILQISQRYLGNSNYWQYILKYNGVSSLNQLQIGTVLLIPKSKIKTLELKMDEANNALQEAVQMGAKVLSEELLENAYNAYQKAIKEKNNLDYDLAISFANESTSLAKNAYNKTKEIREKTIDAVISFKKGNVQKLFPSISTWQPAELYDNLRENDWARTLSLSLANITFYDLSQIKLNENSQAIIQSSRYDPIANNSTTKVRLEKGDAYAMLLNTPKKKFDLDIKGIKTKINSKYFWVEKELDKTKLSNYNGEIAIQVKDSAVVVKKNQGSVVPANGYPSKPKNLLQAPALLEPANLSSIISTQNRFSWTKKNNAPSYWLEIAYDVNFTKIFKLIKEIKSESVDIRDFPNGVYYWHVCSVDEMNLPGNYSEYRTFVIARDKNLPYLIITHPSDNFIATEKEIIIKGVADPLNIITINGKEVKSDQKGEFSFSVNLEVGFNTFNIYTSNREGYKSSSTRTIYYESDKDLKVIDEKLGDLLKNKGVLNSSGDLRLNLNTNPLALVEVKTREREVILKSFADSIGRCQINFSDKLKYDSYLLTVTTLAGRTIDLNIEISDQDKLPKIYLDGNLELQTNNGELFINGRVENAEQLFINGHSVSISDDHKFSYKYIISTEGSLITCKAVNTKGLTSELRKEIIQNYTPPILLGHNISKIDEAKSLYKINIKAKDVSKIKRTVDFEYFDNGILRREIAQFDEKNGDYSALIRSNGKQKPVLKRIALEDYLSNKKIYEINN